MRPTLVFDADDTLWDEQGVLQQFEAEVEAALDRLTGSATGFRERFIAVENANIPTLGYGFTSYLYSLSETLTADADWYRHKGQVLALVADLVARMQTSGPPVIEGVRPTLEALALRDYRLVLLTRGIEHEQRGKLTRSGLGGFFSEIRIVGRKDLETYRRTAHELGDPAGAALCMIGNSMRSDVVPAIAAGWRAIHVPAPTEWAHDNGGEAVPADKYRRVTHFGQVADLVGSPDFWR
jgi:putative hydrolase of the HAD superfamily